MMKLDIIIVIDIAFVCFSILAVKHSFVYPNEINHLFKWNMHF